MHPQRDPETIKSLVDVECEGAAFIPLRAAIGPFLTEPYVRMLEWQYAKETRHVACWIVADLGPERNGMTLAFSDLGHGSHGNPWGIVMPEENAIQRDDSWFTCLEDAFINSGAWSGPLSDNYEIR